MVGSTAAQPDPCIAGQVVGEGVMEKTYKIRDVEDGSVYSMTLPMILEELNRDRSDEWTKYDETDWREGLAEFTTYEVVEDD
jgi:hypothetical protein